MSLRALEGRSNHTKNVGLRGAEEIPSLCSEQAAQSLKESRRGLIHQTHLYNEIATLPLVARNDYMAAFTALLLVS